VLASVTSSKTIFSILLEASLLKYITFDHLLQAEAGVTVNEPTQIGVRQAIETAVYSLIMEGTLNGLWNFADPAAGREALHAYLLRRDGPSAATAANPENGVRYEDGLWPEGALMPTIPQNADDRPASLSNINRH
jgi:curli production assembly/transport component CsgG